MYVGEGVLESVCETENVGVEDSVLVGDVVAEVLPVRVPEKVEEGVGVGVGLGLGETSKSVEGGDKTLVDPVPSCPDVPRPQQRTPPKSRSSQCVNANTHGTNKSHAHLSRTSKHKCARYHRSPRRHLPRLRLPVLTAHWPWYPSPIGRPS